MRAVDHHDAATIMAATGWPSTLDPGARSLGPCWCRPLPSCSSPVSRRRSVQLLVLAAIAGALLAFSPGALNAWLVSSGVEVGFGEGGAGLLLGRGAASGIAARLWFGWHLDQMHSRPFAMALGALVAASIARDF